MSGFKPVGVWMLITGLLSPAFTLGAAITVGLTVSTAILLGGLCLFLAGFSIALADA